MNCPNCGTRIGFLHRGTTSNQENPNEFPCPSCPAVLKSTGRFFALQFLGFMLAIPAFVTAFFVLAYLHPSSNASFRTDVGSVTSLVILMVLLSGLYVVSMIRVKKIEIVRLRPRCQRCKTFMVVEDAAFCPNCGASMENPAWESITIDEKELQTIKPVRSVREPKAIGTCLICNLELSSDDSVASCPHCHNLFHKPHLVEWVNKKKRCPACGEHLWGSEIRDRPLQSRASKR